MTKQHVSLDRFFNHARRVVVALTLIFWATSMQELLFAQPAIPDVSTVESLLKQGGLFTLILVVFMFYRRDWAKLNESQAEVNKQLIQVVQDNTEALTKVADQSAETNAMLRGLRSLPSCAAFIPVAEKKL